VPLEDNLKSQLALDAIGQQYKGKHTQALPWAAMSKLYLIVFQQAMSMILSFQVARRGNMIVGYRAPAPTTSELLLRRSLEDASP